ncbi:glycosyltransferase family 2 protein [Phenylobacterium sp. J367]|uniref:glycosyltransferase family 2 protein n=1 Tax=Phenylobacterium sp. J367 TaxID=2898435 RepID=UPI0021513B93|nr:glycosyltransferase family 2 protein [Phenylobacterium sp. J367]MCR5879501.1 glycosyltransferase family 2 protein [Phenylobacterium sp. J367]
MPEITAVVLTKDEELHLARAIRSISGICRKVFVVDSGSTDRTVDIAKTLGAEVYTRTFLNHADQLQWSLDNLPIDTEWILRLDADEVLEQDLVRYVNAHLDNLPDEVAGVTLSRKHIFMGRWIRHGGRYPMQMLRLFRRGRAFVEDRWMDEHVVLSSGRTVHFPGGFSDWNLRPLNDFIEKHNRYATREALDIVLLELGARRDPLLLPQRTSLKAAGTRVIKRYVYGAIPFYVSAWLYFIYRYVFRLGFLDGVEGAIYHTLQGFWYRYLVGAKALELRRAIRSRGENTIAHAISVTVGFNVDFLEDSPERLNC